MTQVNGGSLSVAVLGSGGAGALTVGNLLKVARPDLTVVCASGDGDGFSIDGNYFVHAPHHDRRQFRPWHPLSIVENALRTGWTRAGRLKTIESVESEFRIGNIPA